jgi:hypothetical protein
MAWITVLLAVNCFQIRATMRNSDNPRKRMRDKDEDDNATPYGP